MRLHNLFALALLTLTFLPGSLEAACAASQRAKMIKQDIPEETIADICGDIEEKAEEEKKTESKIISTKSSKKKSKPDESSDQTITTPTGWNFQQLGIDMIGGNAYGTDGSSFASLLGFGVDWAGFSQVNPEGALLFNGKYFGMSGAADDSYTLDYSYLGIGIGYALLMANNTALGALASFGFSSADFASSATSAKSTYSGTGAYQELFWEYAGGPIFKIS